MTLTLSEARKAFKKLGYSLKSHKYSDFIAIDVIHIESGYRANRNAPYSLTQIAEHSKVFDLIDDCKKQGVFKDGFRCVL